MTERELNKELIAFREEIKRIKTSDKTMFAVKNPDNLDFGVKKVWEEFKTIFEYSDPQGLSEMCDGLSETSFHEARVNPNQDKTEFMSWLKNKLAVIKSTADSVVNGDLTNAEYNQEMEIIKTSLAK